MAAVLYKPGDTVPESGIYTVRHDRTHVQNHEVTCVKGKKFPPCRDCSSPRFELARPAIHIEDHQLFQFGASKSGPGIATSKSRGLFS